MKKITRNVSSLSSLKKTTKAAPKVLVKEPKKLTPKPDGIIRKGEDEESIITLD